MTDYAQSHDTYEPQPEPLEQPKKRIGWPKGKKRGPRKPKVAAPPDNGKTLKGARFSRDAKPFLGNPFPRNHEDGRKSLAELMFGVDSTTASRIEDAIASAPTEFRRPLIFALQRIFLP
jgi:hypothetical protein